MNDGACPAAAHEVTRRVLCEDGTLHDVDVAEGPGSGYVATFGDVDEGADAWEGTPRAAVTALAAEMHWGVRQILGPEDRTVAEAWQAAADLTRELVGLRIEAERDMLESAANKTGAGAGAAVLWEIAQYHRTLAEAVRSMRLPDISS